MPECKDQLSKIHFRSWPMSESTAVVVGIYILGTLQREGIEAGEPCDSESILVPHSVKTRFPCQTKHIYFYIYISIGIYTEVNGGKLPLLKYIEFGVSHFYDILLTTLQL